MSRDTLVAVRAAAPALRNASQPPSASVRNARISQEEHHGSEWQIDGPFVGKNSSVSEKGHTEELQEMQRRLAVAEDERDAARRDLQSKDAMLHSKETALASFSVTNSNTKHDSPGLRMQKKCLLQE